jgi:hypothetical protein
METMAVTACGGIGIPRKDRLTMDAFSEAIIGMAEGAFLDHPDLIPFPWGYLVDPCMTVFTLDIVYKMGARIMFCPFFFVTSMASDRLCINSRPSRFHMGCDVRNIPVATIARIGSMDGLGEFSLADLGMATETFRVINALIAVFPALDGKPFSLRQGFWRLSYHCWFRALFFRFRFCRPKKRDDAKECQRDDE